MRGGVRTRLSRMSPSLRQQINVTIVEIERKLDRLAFQQQPNPRVIEAEQHELEILRRKLQALPQDEPSIAYA